jgi:hypothetical protein
MLPSSRPTQVAFSSMSMISTGRAELGLEHDLGDVRVHGRAGPRVHGQRDGGVPAGSLTAL